MQRPLPCHALSFVVYAEGRLIAGADGVNLVSFLRTVEVELSVSLIVPVVDGQAVRVAILPSSDSTRGLAAQNGQAFLPGKLPV